MLNSLPAASRSRYWREPRTYEALETRCLLASISLPASQDNTLIQDVAGELSNGAGQHLFTGRTAQPIQASTRRAVLQFDLPQELLGEQIEIIDATLQLHMSRGDTEARSVSLHRLLADWGEGDVDAPNGEGRGATADAESATWSHRRFEGEIWQNLGGDFKELASAATDVAAEGYYEWSSADLVSDVRQWRQDSTANHGWILVGDESLASTSKRFDSREHPTEAQRPILTIEYAVTSLDWHNAERPYDVNNDGSVIPLDALLVINELNGIGLGLNVGRLPVTTEGFQPPPFVDVNGDGFFGPLDALLVINELNRPTDVSGVSAQPAVIRSAIEEGHVPSENDVAGDVSNGNSTIEGSPLAASIADLCWARWLDDDFNDRSNASRFKTRVETDHP